MVAVFNKELQSSYLIPLELKETIEAGIPIKQSNTEEEKEHQQQQDHQEDRAVQVVDHDDNGDGELDWVISIREKLEEARHHEQSCPWAKLSIYRVPMCLQKSGDDTAYVPQIVSIGPYHRHKRLLRDMDRHKWRSLHQILRRTGHDIKLYLDSVRELEDRARSCYEGPISLSSKDLVECLVLDGCFALELFRGAAALGGFQALGYSRSDPVFAIRDLMHSIRRDMIMLENQMPLFVLDRLLALQLGLPADRARCFVSSLVVRFFDPLMPADQPLRKSDLTRLEFQNQKKQTIDTLADQGGLHCLDVYRRSLLHTGTQNTPPRIWIGRRSDRVRVADICQQMIHCVTELREAGVKFQRGKTDRFWDVRFEGGVLEIPRLLIDDGTKSLFLKLIAFEQCHPDCSNDITSYVIFMDNLINGAEDVGYLHNRGIVEHWLGSDEEVADLFNHLCQEVVFDVRDSYLSRLSEQVNRYYNHRWNAWRASLKHNYFGNSWAIVSLVAAFVLLALTFVQTFYTVYSFYKPNN